MHESGRLVIGARVKKGVLAGRMLFGFQVQFMYSIGQPFTEAML